MSTFRFLCPFFCFFLLGGAFSASAQTQSPIAVSKVKFSLENPPQYVTSGGSKPQQGMSSADKWVILEVEFDSAPEWVNEATFEIFVLVKSAGNVAVNLKGKASYQDIAKGTGHKIAMFLSPQTYKRYSGTSTQQAIQDVAVRVTVGGGVVDTFSERTKRRDSQRWWEQVPPQESILRSLADTPWFPLYFGYYEQLKPN